MAVGQKFGQLLRQQLAGIVAKHFLSLSVVIGGKTRFRAATERTRRERKGKKHVSADKYSLHKVCECDQIYNKML
jgi:hypothetical protein